MEQNTTNTGQGARETRAEERKIRKRSQAKMRRTGLPIRIMNEREESVPNQRAEEDSEGGRHGRRRRRYGKERKQR